MEITGASRVMIRTDRPQETKTYLRGGNSFAIDDAVARTVEVLAAGRAVILLEPTDRLANLLTVSIGVDPTGDWRGEVLGPGFDASDLQRGDTLPEWLCTGLPMSSQAHSLLREHAPHIEAVEGASMRDRIRSRLETLVHHVMPAMGADFRRDSEAIDKAELWIAARGYQWPQRDSVISFPYWPFQRAFEVAQLIFQYRWARHQRSPFVVVSSILACHRLVFWDVTDATRKWAI